jgi:hypothetical protein
MLPPAALLHKHPLNLPPAPADIAAASLAAACPAAVPCTATSEHLLSGKSGMMELHIVTKLVPA